mgnify:CR=1 FL=1
MADGVDDTDTDDTSAGTRVTMPVVGGVLVYEQRAGRKELVGVEVDVSPLEECPTLAEVRDALEAGEEIPYKAHMALDYGGMHPNPEKYLQNGHPENRITNQNHFPEST